MSDGPAWRRRYRARADRAAPAYEAAAKLDAEVGNRMLERLDLMRLAPRCILDAGAGTGRDARALARRYAGATLVAVDHSRGMLREIRRSGGLVSRLRRRTPHALCAEMERLPIAGAAIDLVWSNLALHCSDHPQEVLREMARVLKPEGLLLFSAYGPDSLAELASASVEAIGESRVTRFTDMHDLGDMLVAAGMANPVMDMERITVTYADARSFYRDLRETAQSLPCGLRRERGSDGGAPAGEDRRPSPPGLGRRSEINALSAALEARRRDGRLAITFEIVYGHAWKVAQARTPEGHAIVRAPFPRRVSR